MDILTPCYNTLVLKVVNKSFVLKNITLVFKYQICFFEKEGTPYFFHNQIQVF